MKNSELMELVKKHNEVYVSLWALVPALKNRDTAKRYLANAEKILGRPLEAGERAYLEDVIAQGDRVEASLRELGYYDKGARGRLLREHGISVPSEEAAKEILEKLRMPRITLRNLSYPKDEA